MTYSTLWMKCGAPLLLQCFALSWTEKAPGCGESQYIGWFTLHNTKIVPRSPGSPVCDRVHLLMFEVLNCWSYQPGTPRVPLITATSTHSRKISLWLQACTEMTSTELGGLIQRRVRGSLSPRHVSPRRDDICFTCTWDQVRRICGPKNTTMRVHCIHFNYNLQL